MKEFNITTTCIKEQHYMVDISNKLEKINNLIDKGKYFTINRARQYGKTTTMSRLFFTLKDKYIIIPGSLEDFGEETFKTEKNFSNAFLTMLNNIIKFQDNALSNFIKNIKEINTLQELSLKITDICLNSNKEIVLMIDEVDKAASNILFLDFLGVLRDKYNKQKIGIDKTFKSVILAGVHDVKNLKVHIKERRMLTEKEAKLIDKTTYNSPWNVAEDFKVNMSFDPKDISTMLIEYENDYNLGINIEEISNEIYDYTSGYPYLVSKICKVIDEELNKEWNKDQIQMAVKIIVNNKNTLFDSLIKNIESDIILYKLIEKIILLGDNVEFNIYEPHINKAFMYGILKRSSDNRAIIHNKVFELIIYNYMVAKNSIQSKSIVNYEFMNQFLNTDKTLNMEKILEKFQDLMEEEYRDETQEFVEKEGRLLFLMFIKPIINGVGFYDVEVETRTNKRMDIIITYNNKRYIVELKKWYGKKYENKGYKQLVEYMNIKKIANGYMLMFDFRKNKKYTKKWIEVDGKKFLEIIV
jgi:hypothetical protein